MTIIGNSLLFIAALLYFSLVTALYGKTPKGGDAVVSYLWGIIFINAAFWICINLVSIIIAFKGGFDWISHSKTTRHLLVYLGLFIICLTTTLSGLFKNEHNVPLLRLYSFFVPTLVPLVLVVVAAILLNGSLRMRSPEAAKIAFVKAGAIGGVPGSPTPPGCSSLSIICTSTCGIVLIITIW